MELSDEEKLHPSYRARFAPARFEFGFTLMNIVRCPACPRDANPKPEILHIKGATEEMLGHDIDGITAEFNDRGL